METLTPSAEDQPISLEISCLSGKCLTLHTHSAASVPELLEAAEALVGVPASRQHWIADSNELSFEDVTTLADTKLCNGDRVTVVYSAFPTLVDPSDQFSVTFTSVRERLRTSYSSAFIILYIIKANIADGRACFQPWRKNDHDKHVYDSKAKTVQSCRSHWMSGSSASTHELEGDPLMDFVSAWRAPHKSVLQDSERFWLPCGEEAPPTRTGSCDDLGSFPSYAAVPGWFVSPDQDCAEIDADIPLFGMQRIVRLLIDKDGTPVRAAIRGCKAGCLHEDIEEFDVAVVLEESTSV